MNIENLVRSGVVLAIGLPVALSLNGLVGNTSALLSQSKQQSVSEELKGELTKDCLVYAMTEVDSKLERQSIDNIDEIFGGEVDYDEVCSWALR